MIRIERALIIRIRKIMEWLKIEKGDELETVNDTD